MRRYGIPYQGSKSRIADWIISIIPPADTFVDLFAGGCAITHAAILSGKYKHFIANDIGDGPQIFKDAVNGEYDGYSTVPNREEFMKSDDPVIKILYSFGTNQRDYFCSKSLEPVKIAAQKMLLAPSIHERRNYYRDFIKELSAMRGRGELEDVERIEGLERLENLCGLLNTWNPNNLAISNMSYQFVEIPDGATVYCDPPYKNAKNSKNYTGRSFDYDAFERWLAYVPFPVYVSEYDAPAGCVEIASKDKVVTMSATSTGTVTEKLFVQKRFAIGGTIA